MKRILIVDDMEDNLYLLRTLLEAHNYTVDEAFNGSDAIIKAQSSLPDLVISDILMPVIDGFTLCRIWKADRRFSRIPFIFYTATYTDPRDEKLALDIGADAFIIKPTEPDEFMRRVEEILVLDREGKFTANQPVSGSESILKNYSEALIRKLEQKMLELQKLNRELENKIEEKNSVEVSLRESLSQKKELIKEIFHRTKNSMQVIISIFSLQSIYSGDEKLSKILKDMENRIRAMSLVHEKLYQSNNLSKVNLKEYLAELAGSIMSGYGIPDDKIHRVLNMNDAEVLIDTAIPCGLVVNELVSNVVKHAFPGGMTGIMEISLISDRSGMIELSVSDNGTGAIQADGSGFTESMGLEIVKNIIGYQLRGSLELDRSGGVKWIIKFRDDIYEERI